MRFLFPVFFYELNFVPPKEILIQQVCFMCRYDKLLTRSGTRVHEELQYCVRK